MLVRRDDGRRDRNIRRFTVDDSELLLNVTGTLGRSATMKEVPRQTLCVYLERANKSDQAYERNLEGVE